MSSMSHRVVSGPIYNIKFHKMKISKYIILFLLGTVFTACTSDDQYVFVPISTTPPNDEVLPSKLVVTVDGQTFDKTASCDRAEDRFTVTGKMKLIFDKNGHLGTLELSYPESETINKKFYAPRDNSSAHFSVVIESIDTVKQRIKGRFSGYVFANATNINSESKYISGTFDTDYALYPVTISNLGNSAKINGVDWQATNYYPTRIGSQYITYHYIDDQLYKIKVHYLQFNTGFSGSPIVVYNFTSADASNKVELSRFDPATRTYTDFNCSGTLNITIRQNTVYGGNYTFTAVNPNNPSEIIQVTDGNYKLGYVYFPE